MNVRLPLRFPPFLKPLLPGIICWALPVLLFAQLPLSEVPWQKGELLYANSLATAGQVDDWVMEGPGEIRFEAGWMHMQSPGEAYHHVFWCPREFPEDFVAEWEVQNLETDAGLLIAFFAAKGQNGEDLFDPALPERDGTFSHYTQGALRNYHISYYAHTPDSPDRGDSHIRKNPGFALVQSGQEGIPTASTAIHRIRLIRSKGHIRMYVDERKILDWMDREDLYGPLHGGGKIGFRQMMWTHFRYRNFRVWKLASRASEIPLAARALHPRYRAWVSPADGQIARVNPPALLWPAKRQPGARYAIRLSKDPAFPGEQTLAAENLSWALFNPHQKLGTGIWYWQYRIGNNPWSSTASFFVSGAVPVFEMPPAQELIAAVPKAHPRLLAFPDEQNLLRSRAKDPDAQVILQRANALLNTDPPAESMGIAPFTSNDPTEQNKHKKDASKKLGVAARRGIEAFSQAYLLTGEERYAAAAIRWALAVAHWDHAGVSYHNDFGDSDCMVSMAMAYDACFGLLDAAQKTRLEQAITARAQRFHDGWLTEVETKVYSAHVWQHIIERQFKTALALLGEVPEAAGWLSYLYELWLARAPVLGPEDGGWWNGSHYAELNALTLMDIPMILEKLTGIDHFRSPFYQNVPYWLIYSFPPQSYSEGFGNGTEKQFGQKMGMLGFADALGRRMGIPYAHAYADWHLQAMGKTLLDDDAFRWYRLRWQQNDRQPPADLATLPQARHFPETGSVNMHSDLAQPQHDLMLSMRSSPFGSSSHAHADQNGFNIQYAGQKLFHNSGYRPSMGVPHYEDWFKATIGHNSVLIDGKGQPTASAESYGWLPRFLHGEQISYCLGDASNAYDNAGEKRQQADLKRFRRHLVFLRPATIVVYDELEADHDAQWTWLLHSPEKISLDSALQRLHCETTTARSQVDLLGSQPLAIEIGTKFDPEPENYRGIRDEDGDLIIFKDQWHVYARPQQATARMRYLAVIQVKGLADTAHFAAPVPDGAGRWQLGEWQIQAQLDGYKAAQLEIRKADGSAALGYGVDHIRLGDAVFSAKTTGSTLLGEMQTGKSYVQEAVDALPKAVWQVPGK